MDVRFKEISRGSGKIYCRIALCETDDDTRIEARSETTAGELLPATLSRVDEVEGVVLVLPVIDVAQHATVRVLDAQGNVIGCGDKIVSPRLAKLQSQINTARKNKVALTIRNCDAKPKTYGIEVAHTIEIACGNGEDILHGEVRVVSWNRDAAGDSLKVRVLDGHGKSVVLDEIVVLGDKLRADDEYPGLYVRTLSFSARIPSEVGQVLLWAISSSELLQDSFVCIEPYRIREMRDEFLRNTLSAERDGEYEAWFLGHLRGTALELDSWRRNELSVRPKFSLVTVIPPRVEHFREMVDSVLGQTYSDFELILVGVGLDEEWLKWNLASREELDSRIRLVNLPKYLGITLSTNEGIACASGDFICLLDSDCLVEPDLLYHYAKGVSEYPETDLLYCDEDKLINGHFCQVFAKPDWSPDLICSCNYMGHMLAVRKTVVDQIGVSGSEFDGAHDFNLALAASERARNVYHVRRVLYHWRSGEESSSPRWGIGSYSESAAVLALQNHLDRMNVKATARLDENVPMAYRLDYEFDEYPLVSIVIPNKDHIEVLDRCLVSLREKTTYKNYEVIIVENNSENPETFAYYDRVQRKWDRVRVVVEQNTFGLFNFAKSVNFGFAHARGDFFLMLNNDTEVIAPDWIEQLVGTCSQRHVGICGAKLLYPDGLIQHGGVCFHHYGPGHLGLLLPANTDSYYHAYSLTQDLSAVTGACLMCNRETYERVGGLDEAFRVNYNDIDFCVRVRELGLHVVFNPHVLLYHYESVSRDTPKRGKEAYRSCRETGMLYVKYPRYYVDGDPFLNPALVRNSVYRALKKYVD